MNYVKENRNLYLSLIESWTRELEINNLSLKVSAEMKDGKAKIAFIRCLKNPIKRCKWNITRANNLLNAK